MSSDWKDDLTFTRQDLYELYCVQGLGRDAVCRRLRIGYQKFARLVEEWDIPRRRRVYGAPPCTREEFVALYCGEGVPIETLARRLRTCRKTLRLWADRWGVAWRPPWVRGYQAPARRRLAEEGCWRSGDRSPLASYPNYEGGYGKGRRSARYRMVRLPGHPHANSAGYVPEHIAVALAVAGRLFLLEGEEVHHVDLDPLNNTPANLVICSGSDHRRYHSQLLVLVGELVRQGWIVFRPGKGYGLAGRCRGERHRPRGDSVSGEAA